MKNRRPLIWWASLGLLLFVSGVVFGIIMRTGSDKGVRSISPRVATSTPAPCPPPSTVPVPEGVAVTKGIQQRPTSSAVSQSASNHTTSTVTSSSSAPSGSGALMDPLQMDAAKYRYIEEVLAARAERARLVWRIDTWLTQRGSPMAGMGECYVENQERTGIPATLSVGIAEAESSSGMACFNHCNAWGMIAEGPFGCWQEGIVANFDYLVRNFGCPQTMHDCPGYCVGDGTMPTVDAVQAAIMRLDATAIH